MSIDTVCHTKSEPEEANAVLDKLRDCFPSLFREKFLLYPARKPHEIDKEIEGEYSFNATSVFRMNYNDKEAFDLSPVVDTIVRDAFGADNILMLFQNETPRPFRTIRALLDS